GADVDRYSFIVVDLHHLLLVGLPAHFESSHASQAVVSLWVRVWGRSNDGESFGSTRVLMMKKSRKRKSTDKKAPKKSAKQKPAAALIVQREGQKGGGQQAAASETAGRGCERYVSLYRRCLVTAVFRSERSPFQGARGLPPNLCVSVASVPNRISLAPASERGAFSTAACWRSRWL